MRAALSNCEFQFPSGRVTVNLAPADLPKDGGRFDLAIAIGILVAIPAVAAFNYFQRIIKSRLARAGALGHEVLANLKSVRGA